MNYSDQLKQQAAKLYAKGLNLKKIAKVLRISSHTVPKILRELGMPIRPCSQRKYTLDEDYFTSVNTEAKSYWVGFLLADGCVCNTHAWSLQVNLRPSDVQHLEKLMLCLGSNRPVSTTADKARLGINSKKICTDLIRLGVTPRKSLTAKPAIVPPHLGRHYFRGLFDGDGCIGQPSRGRGFRLCFCGSYAVVSNFRSWARVKTKMRRIGKIWELQSADQQKVISTLETMYDGASIYLDRKYEDYKDAVRLYYSMPSKRRSRDPTTGDFTWIDEPKQLPLQLF